MKTMSGIKLCQFSYLMFFTFVFNYGLIADPVSGWFYQQSPVSSSYRDIKFTDDNNGIIAGENGTILKTTNSGDNWILMNSGTNKNLNSISISSPSEFYIAGDSGIILKSTDEGNSWVRLGITDNNNLNFISFKNNIGFAAGDKGTLLRTTNSGLNWDETFSDTSVSFKSISFLKNNFIWATGQKRDSTFLGGLGYLIKTTNLGLNWNLVTPKLNDLYIGYSIVFLDSLNGFCGYCSTILNWGVLVTYDAGLTWECVSGAINCCPNSLFFINSYTGFSIGEGTRAIFKTTTGVNWYPSLIPFVFENLKTCYFVNDLTGWAVGGRILKTTNGGEVLTNLISTSEKIPSEFSLSQNYPNPFNPSTKIKFDIPKTIFAKLTVYNSEGKRIESLFNGNLQEGSYEMSFDGNGYPSGVYYYRLETNEFTISKKMLLLK